MMQHEGGAISILSASYASASEYYLMNIYGKQASAYYDHFGGLRCLRRGEESAGKVSFEKNDAIAEELAEFAACVRTGGAPEVGGRRATESLAVIRAGVKSAREGRVVEVAEILESDEE
jgi:predicted dehydrogenase